MSRIQGQTLLEQFTQAEASVEAEISQLEQSVQAQESAIAESNRQREAAYLDLASVYCDQREQLAAELSQVSAELQRQFDAKRARRSEIEGDITRASEAAQNHNTLLAGLREQRDAAAREHEQATARWQAVLEASEEIRDLRTRHAQAEAWLKSVQQTEARVQEESRVVRSAYEQDELFMYLHRSGFGRETYRGGSLRRRIDGWFAERIRWSAQAENYQVLLEVPGMAARRVAEASAERRLLHDRLNLRVREHEHEQGADLTRLRLETSIQAVETMGRRIEEDEQRHESFLVEKAALEANKDPFVSRAKQAIREMLAGEPVRQLRERAQRTGRQSDLALIERIETSEAAVNSGREQVKRLRGERDQLQRRATRVRGLARRFSSEYTDTYDFFSEDLDLGSLIVAYQLGRVSEKQFWGTLDDAYTDMTPSRSSGFDGFSWSGGSDSSSSSGGFDSGGFSGGGDCGGGGASFGGGD